jgi:hypothetical protein
MIPIGSNLQVFIHKYRDKVLKLTVIMMMTNVFFFKFRYKVHY